ncbi:MAG TPA: electron transfer flavoprotein subunit alpha/FixB family protein [Desulfatiglandales bacterium]|nr:electron transfer flavoprotein subunit alpha/FixB family protein [Desulfatiglandales bacterium]
MSDILILVESKAGAVEKMTLELIRGAGGLAKDLGTGVSAVVVGADTAALAEAVAGYGLNKVYRLEHPLLKDFQPDAWVAGLEWLCKQIAPKIVLISQAFVGREVAPRLAYRLNTELTTDCTALKIDPADKGLIRTKPIYGGNAVAIVKTEGSPQLVTVRKGLFEPAEPAAKSEVVSMAPPLADSVIKVKSVKTVEQEVVELDKANVVISGGRGIAEKEDFEVLFGLAKALSKTHGKVLIGCSRPVVDKGWMSSDHQVGLTGSMISPDAYVAIGISGAVQHLVGMIRSKKIIAINTDLGCNMFKVADFGVVADYKEILPALIKKLEE